MTQIRWTANPPILGKNGSATWTEVEPQDVLDGLRTLHGHGRGTSILHWRKAKDNYETFLRWALDEFQLGERATAEEARRHWTQAVAHAKRAIDNLVDAYLYCDWLDVRLGSKPTFSRKLRLISERPGSWVPSRIIPPLISGPRNVAEHEHTAPSRDDAELAVLVAEVVIIAMLSKRKPTSSPAISAGFMGGHGSGPEGDYAYFDRFTSHFGWTWRGTSGTVWAGVGAPLSETEVEMRYCALAAFTKAQHFELLEWWDASGSDRCGVGEPILRRQFELAGLARE